MTKSKLSAKTKVVNGKYLYNDYECEDCLEDGFAHSIIDVPGPMTDSNSHWGEGLPTTYRECTSCGRRDGPWISSELVDDEGY